MAGRGQLAAVFSRPAAEPLRPVRVQLEHMDRIDDVNAQMGGQGTDKKQTD